MRKKGSIFVGWYIVIAIVLNIVLESLNRKSVIGGFAYFLHSPWLFLFNTLIILFTLCLALLFRRELFVLSLMTIVWLGFGIANFVILHFRVTPFSAVDFTLLKSAISVSGHYLSVFNVLMIVMAVVILLVSIICLFIRAPKRQHMKKISYVRTVAFVIFLALMIVLIKKNSKSVQALSTNYTNISEAYENYGFAYCFANSVIDTGISKPEDYSEESVQNVLSKVKKQDSDSSEKPNIIFVQLESFFDVFNVKGLQFSEDPIPNFHKLQKEYSHGYLTVPTVGAGTVNTEFEILTGMRQRDFGVGEYPYKTVLKEETAESICYDLKKLGYTSHCVHNNEATFYGRNLVFSNLGFDTFTPIESMNGVTDNPNGWSNDDVMAGEINKTLSSTKGPDFTLGITVQSHGKYDGVTDYPKQVLVSGAPEGEEEAYQYYVNEIHEVDQMIGNLVKMLKARKEKTILVLYGDHLPSLDLTAESLKNDNLYQTEYVVWDNYGLKKEDKDLSSYEIAADVMNRAGIHEGTIMRYHQQYDAQDSNYLQDLKTLEYDLFYGENYQHDQQNIYEPSDLKIGTYPVKVKKVEQEGNDCYIVTGNGFTKYSKVYYGGKQLDTVWVDEHHLRVTGEIAYDESAEEKYDDSQQQEDTKKFEDDIPNTLVVETCSEDGTELACSAPFSYEDMNLCSEEIK